MEARRARKDCGIDLSRKHREREREKGSMLNGLACLRARQGRFHARSPLSGRSLCQSGPGVQTYAEVKLPAAASVTMAGVVEQSTPYTNRGGEST